MKIQDYLDYDHSETDAPEGTFLHKHVSFIQDDTSFSSKLKYDVALLGVPDNENSKTFEAAGQIKKKLYELVPLSSALNIIDLGNIKPGHTYTDTCYAIREVTVFINQLDVIVLLIGGTSKFNMGSFLASEKMNSPVNMVTIDSVINRGKIPLLAMPDLNLEHPEDITSLFNYINIGYQSYFVDKKLLNFIDDSYYEAYRLGYVRANLKEMEPVLRDANLISFSLNAVKHSDAPGTKFSSPNGLYGDEACQLAFYAGHSNRIKSFGLFDVAYEIDFHSITAMLAAQIIWYFLEGLSNAIFEEPDTTPENFTKFLIHLSESDQHIAFYRSNLTNRWWMEISYPDNNRNLLLSCSEADYELACQQDIPDRWLRTFQRISH
jgi:formiminoglutamase